MKAHDSPGPLALAGQVDRGDCTFVHKVRNAQRAGAVAVLIADNTCLCNNSVCIPEEPDQTCQARYPILTDDGSGNDIAIPSFLLFKQDADPIKDTLKNNTPVQVEMSYPMPSPDAPVEYELWTVPTDPLSQAFEQTFQDAAVALGSKAYFTPHMYVYDGIRAHCYSVNGSFCYNLCTNSGRYCAAPPDGDIDSVISGADVVKESLRRLCVWSKYGTTDGVGKKYWNYLNEFIVRCGDATKPELFMDEQCVADAMAHANVTKSDIDQCMDDSGGLEGDVTNTMLDMDAQAKEDAGIVVFPTLMVNNAPVKGQLSFATAFKAICAGYLSGSEPSVCKECADCPNPACVRAGKCRNDVGSSADGTLHSASVSNDI